MVVPCSLPKLYVSWIALRDHGRTQAPTVAASDRTHRVPVRASSDLRQRELAEKSNRAGNRAEKLDRSSRFRRLYRSGPGTIRAIGGSFMPCRSTPSELGDPREAPVVGFVGRLTKDKGVGDLIEAFLEMRTHLPALRLLLVGDFEPGDPLLPATHRIIQSDPHIVHIGFVDDPVPYYHAMDVFAFPTRREGFGNAAMEASAAGKPVVSARATGAVDAVIDGVTGILVPVGDANALARTLERVLEDKALAVALGAAGRERVQREFRREIVWDAIIEEYLQQLQDKGLPLPRGGSRKFVPTAEPVLPVVSQ